jgi:hypothetical protein
MAAKDAQKRECDARCGTEMRQGEAVKWGIILKSKVLPELQRFYGRAIIIVTPVEMPISDINRPCQSSFSFYTCQFTG